MIKAKFAYPDNHHVCFGFKDIERDGGNHSSPG